MSTFDVTFPNAARPQVGQVADQPVLEVAVPVGFPLPAGGQAVAVHIGTLRFGLDKEDATAFFKAGLEAAEKLPEPSKIEVASSLDGVEDAVNRMSKLK